MRSQNCANMLQRRLRKRRDKRGHSPLDECNKSVSRSFPSSANYLLLLWRLFDNDRQIFGFVSLLPFLVFGFHLCYYWACYDCGKRYKYDKEPNLLLMLAMITTLLLSLGCVIATIHLIIDFNKFCQPPLGE